MSAIEYQPRRLRLDGAIRTSHRKKDARSPQQQRNMISACEQSHEGYQVLTIHDSGRDESGKTMNRSTLNAVMERVERGETDGLIVALADRLGRAPIEEAMAYVRRLTGIGVLVLADMGGVPLNLNDPAQESNLVFQLQMARQYWLTTANRAQASRTEAVAEGRYVGSAVAGFDKVPKDHPDKDQRGKLVANDDAPFMREVIIAAGTGGLIAAQDMLAERWPTKRWDADRTRKLLGSPAYKGWSVSGDLVNRRAHTGIVSETEWEMAQHEAGPRRPNGDYPLSGIATCECGAPMVGQLKSVPGRKRSYRTYRCSATAHLSISGDALETHVRDWLRPALEGRHFDVQFGDAELAAAQAILKRARDEKDEFTSDLEWQRALGRDGRLNHVNALNVAIDQAEADYQLALNQTKRASQKIPSAQDLDTPEGLRDAAALAVTVQPIVVTAGRGPVERRVALPQYDHSAGVLAA